jgi:hypothetical protein
VVSAAARLAAAVTVSFAAVLLGATAPVAGEAGPVTFGLVAAADGLRMVASVPGAPGADQLVDFGGLRAQAALDGLGTSTATAGIAHPGDLAAGVPAFVRGQTGVPAPDVPLVVVSSHPTNPDAESASGPFRVQARSAAGSSTARADAAGPADPPRGVSTATVRRDDATLAAEAASVIEGFRAGPLTIGRAAVRSSATRAADGTLQRSASFEVTGADVAGTPIGLGPDGLIVAGTQVPLPDTSPVRSALAERGLTVTYLAGNETADGIVSPGLQVSVRADANLAGSGASVVTWTLGRAVAVAASTPAAGELPTVPDIAVPGSEPGTVATPGALTGSDPSAELVPPAGVSGGAVVAGRSGEGAGTSAITESEPPVAALAGPVAVDAETALTRTRALPDRWLSLFYVVLAVAGGAVLVTGQVLRALGVRDLWSS